MKVDTEKLRTALQSIQRTHAIPEARTPDTAKAESDSDNIKTAAEMRSKLHAIQRTHATPEIRIPDERKTKPTPNNNKTSVILAFWLVFLVAFGVIGIPSTALVAYLVINHKPKPPPPPAVTRPRPRRPRRHLPSSLGTTNDKNWPGGTGKGSITREWWADIQGVEVALLTANPNFPGRPTGTQSLRLFEAQYGWGDNYGSRVYGLIHPPVTGYYTFWISGDDNTQLWLSTDHDPANKVMIAEVPGWTWTREWTKFQSQKSIQIKLFAGKQYYIEALHKEGVGGDHLAASWKVAGYPQTVIGGRYLSPGSDLKPIAATDPVAASRKKEWELRVARGESAEAPSKMFEYLPTGNPDIRILIAAPGQTHLVAGGRSSELTVWNTRTKGKETFKLPAKLQCAAVSPNTRVTAVAVKGGQVLLYQLDDCNAACRTLRSRGSSARAISYFPDGKRLVLATVGKKIEIWNLTGNKVAECSIMSTPRCLMISPDGKTIACGLSKGDILLINAADLKTMAVLKGHEFAVKAIDFSSDGSQLLSGSDDLTLRLWKTSGESLRTFTGHFSLITGAAILADGKRAVSSSMDGTLRIWQLSTGKELKKIELTSDGLSCMTRFPDRTGITVAGRDGLIYIVSGRSLK